MSTKDTTLDISHDWTYFNMIKNLVLSLIFLSMVLTYFRFLTNPFQLTLKPGF